MFLILLVWSTLRELAFCAACKTSWKRAGSRIRQVESGLLLSCRSSLPQWLHVPHFAARTRCSGLRRCRQQQRAWRLAPKRQDAALFLRPPVAAGSSPDRRLQLRAGRLCARLHLRSGASWAAASGHLPQLCCLAECIYVACADPPCLLQANGNGTVIPDGSVSLVLLAGGVGKRMGVRPLCRLVAHCCDAACRLLLPRLEHRVAWRSIA